MKRWIKFTRSVHDKFPAAVAHLNGAATADEIARLELRFGQALPLVLHELFGTNNGETRDSPGVVFGIRFLSIDDILGVLDSWQEIIDGGLDGLNDSCTSKPKGAIRRVYANRFWLPLFSDDGGNFVGLDFDPDTKGVPGQVINFGRDEEEKQVLAKDLDKFVAQLTQILGWKNTVGAGNGGFSIAELHFIDAIKNIRNLPIKDSNPDSGHWSFWLCPGNADVLPGRYFLQTAAPAKGESFFADFRIQRKGIASSSGARRMDGEPLPLADLLARETHANVFLPLLVSEAARLGVEKAGYVHIEKDYIHVPGDDDAPDARMVFAGTFKVV